MSAPGGDSNTSAGGPADAEFGDYMPEEDEDEEPDQEDSGDFEAEDSLDPGGDWQSPIGEHTAATFDVLILTSLLRVSGPATDVDLHVFAYLACLMSIYAGEPAAAWGYQFSAVPPTLPYSTALAEATAIAVEAGLLRSDEAGRARVLTTTEPGERLLDSMKNLNVFRRRPEYLSASASTALLHTLPGVVNSVVSEPELLQALRVAAPRLLLRERNSQDLYAQFRALSEALGSVESDLLVPASVYVRFLEERLHRPVSSRTEGTAR